MGCIQTPGGIFYLFIVLIPGLLCFQEGDWAVPASPEAGVLRQTGHESHPHRPAHDLHASHRLHGQFHEEVSRPPSASF